MVSLVLLVLTRIRGFIDDGIPMSYVFFTLGIMSMPLCTTLIHSLEVMGGADKARNLNNNSPSI